MVHTYRKSITTFLSSKRSSMTSLKCFLWLSMALISVLPMMFTNNDPNNEDFLYLKHLFNTSDWSLFLFAFIVFLIIGVGSSIVSPFFVYYVLGKFKSGYLYSQQLVKKSNTTTVNVQSQTLFISHLTAIQGTVWILYGIYIGKIRINLTVSSDDSLYLLTFLKMILKVWLMLFIADFASYGYHRLSHEWRWFYRHIHSLHHENKYPNHSFYALQYGTAVDMFLSNVCFFCGFLLVENDLYTCALYGFVSTLYVSAGHSGLLLPYWLDFLLDSNYHSLHHQKYTVNFAEHFTLIDRLFGSFAEPR